MDVHHRRKNQGFDINARNRKLVHNDNIERIRSSKITILDAACSSTLRLKKNDSIWAVL